MISTSSYHVRHRHWRRVAAFDKGDLPDYPAEEVFAEARRLLR